jgi:hypothetical protein
VCGLLSAARGRCLASGVAGNLSREVLRSGDLCSTIGVGGGQEYLNERGTSMLLLTMALMRKGRVSRPCRGRYGSVSQEYARCGPFATVWRSR